MRARILFLFGAVTAGAAGVAVACGQTSGGSDTGDASVVPDASGTDAQATGTIGAACFPNLTCFAPLECVGGVCVMEPDSGPNPPVDAGDAGVGCAAVPTFTSACFAMGHNACSDGTCVDFVEAGCPPVVGFSGTWPLQCGKNADCDAGHCCAGASFSGALSATAKDTCLVDTTKDTFYSKATTCSASACLSPVCATDADCSGGQHCAVMRLTNDAKGPVVGVCVD